MWIAIQARHWQHNWQIVLQEIACAMTPAVFWCPQDTLLLDLHNSLLWLGGIKHAKHRLKRELRQADLKVRLAIAPSAVGARLLAQNVRPSKRWHYALSPKRLATALDPLSVSALTEAKPYVKQLKHIGCHRLGQLRALDRSALAERSSLTLIEAIDQAYGLKPWFGKPVKLAAQFRRHQELPRLVEQSHALEPYLKLVIQALCLWLTEGQWQINQLECRLHHRDRRRAWPPTVVILSVAQPTNQFSVLWRWLQTRLENIQLVAAVSDLSVISRSLTRTLPQNLTLFDTDTALDDTALQTLDLLRARIGHQKVRYPSLRNDYRPDTANQWSDSAPSTQPDNRWYLSPLGSHPHSPAWLLARPQPLSNKHDRPYLQGPLRIRQGPYRIETGWWDHERFLRDYFVASDDSARRYWIYRERDGLEARWFLHGLFG